jgi:hypothetical protein
LIRSSLFTRSGFQPFGTGVFVHPSGDVTPPCPD